MSDRSRLLKFLELLSSDNDGEALAAARKAAALAQARGLSWSDWIASPPGAVPDVQGVVCRNREVLWAPLGGTWLETVMFLCSRRAGATPEDNAALDRLASRLTKEPNFRMPEHLARAVCNIHAALTGEPPHQETTEERAP